MPSAPLRRLALGACLWGLIAGCAAGIPSQLAQQVSWHLSIIDIRRHPEAYRGPLVVAVLSARRVGRDWNLAAPAYIPGQLDWERYAPYTG